ncbi:glycosyltransferase family 39 protein [Shewanella fidelis]|uniref:Glycosyltransferase family 39 protein n=1 Tax=Shewanella fidelis TaxID=173509 RepID=A0AAW8NHE1_9GAMM|nr:glycosyltransferase family 39 protein [Shewanella fidelis]MDR8522292.1 glycosyltransferase family 39 protein [Shewanella fidelis]MDW4812492.1 glycosyltransferase family 39 protein [Shewanella fidelis]MDW4816239.1 glycosyltransferase family 39 protein [Shewanella fidelis]MDW4820733.1 glycosyltransferase family 39 protein [Shewanella fidelis]MDW4824955.1 glycosyltransferase family 39 protein [Shewanella fidelis]
MLKAVDTRVGLGVLLVVVLTRMLLLPWYPLMDTTEARYGEMARLMVETGNWITPLFDYNVPFWGKPPLHTWMSASAITLFGVNEFAVRFPHWLAAVLTLLLVGLFTKRVNLPVLPTLIILASTVVFTISAGAVMTDMALTLGLTLAMIGFYLCWQGDKLWGYAGFVGLAIGLLAKGPVTLVLFALGSGLWLLWHYGPLKLWRELWRRVQLVGGCILMLAIAAPWYVIAEQTTPGFLNYFIIGEHFSRFVDSGWQGDLYGSAHDEVRGTIWIYFVMAAMPWSLFLPFAVYKVVTEDRSKLNADELQQADVASNNQQGLASFFICWMIAPMVLFTFAGNILPAYVLPGIPGLALFLGYAWRNKALPGLNVIALCIPALLLLTVAVLQFDVGKDKSERWLLAQRSYDLPTYYWQQQPFSGRFYSAGTADKITNMAEIDASGFYLVIANRLEPSQFGSCRVVASNSRRDLLQCHRD